jgi:predicted hotdog family 3-hydroxylacyl-ACP dehydratase
MIDRLLSWENGAGQADAVVRPDGYLIDAVNRLDRSALIEMMAQTYAAGKGWEGRGQGQAAPRLGYLVGIRVFTWTGDARVGDRLRISVATEGRFGEFRVVSGRICRQEDNRELGRGELRLWRPPAADPRTAPEGGAA